jgi:hypothetical protein
MSKFESIANNIEYKKIKVPISDYKRSMIRMKIKKILLTRNGRISTEVDNINTWYDKKVILGFKRFKLADLCREIGVTDVYLHNMLKAKRGYTNENESFNKIWKYLEYETL